MTTAEEALIALVRSELTMTQAQLISERAKSEALALRSGELERAANIVAAQAAELCRQLRGGGMEHTRTEP